MVFNFLEFMPYTFQILAQLLEFHNVGNVGETYTILYPFLLTPALWEKTSNIHPLVRLLRSYVRKTSPENFEKSLNIVSIKTKDGWLNSSPITHSFY